MDNTVVHNKDLCYLNNMLGYKQLRNYDMSVDKGSKKWCRSLV